ncbi:cytochrome p450 oxidoreductase [Diplodia corticola]|uniref:Cytochrome p450 oxidoreductase n=1 Tax=Diplodia corticola TaxID=236234 RepID=A0A1J9QT14_9PEZI|nr:cytochrome p450 oxidoreductase [Diplodia corticola]OJD31584.1 cytochrome p450 oxidoreductase [Diplodia corticola]
MTAEESISTAWSLLKSYWVPLLLALIAVRLLRNKFRAGLSGIPGPPVAAYTGLWRFFDVAKGQAHWTHINLHKKYGPLVRIGPNHVSVGDPAEIPNIYGLNKGYTKSGFYPIQSISWHKKPQMNIFSTRDEKYHRDQKRPIANAYSLTSLLVKEDAVDSCSKLFMEQLGSFVDLNKPVDLGQWLQYYAFDVIGEISFARKLGFLQAGTDVDGMMETIAGILVYASLCGQLPEWHPFLLGNPLFPILIPSMESWNSVLTFTLKAVNTVLSTSSSSSSSPTDEKKEASSPSSSSSPLLERDGDLSPAALSALDARGDMLSRWSALRLADPPRLTTRDMVVHLSTNVFAGSDTTAIALRAILYFLLKNPRTLRKLVAEIDGAADAGLLVRRRGKESGDDYGDGDGDDAAVGYREAVAHLPYLEAVAKEAMRLHPSVGLGLERVVPPQGAEVCGRWIPGGTVVGVNAWVVQHDGAVFEEPERFRPERWLDAGDEERRRMEASFLAFGAGSRTCLGKHISMMEMMKVVPQLLREFEVELEGGNESREWKVKNRWFVQQEGLICTLRRRDRKGEKGRA